MEPGKFFFLFRWRRKKRLEVFFLWCKSPSLFWSRNQTFFETNKKIKKERKKRSVRKCQEFHFLLCECFIRPFKFFLRKLGHFYFPGKLRQYKWKRSIERHTLNIDFSAANLMNLQFVAFSQCKALTRQKPRTVQNEILVLLDCEPCKR